MTATQTCVAMADTHRMTRRTAQFIDRNYLAIGPLNVVGQFLRPLDAESFSFEVVIPTTYAVVTKEGRAEGWLDDETNRNPRALRAGTHTFKPAHHGGALAVVWSQAIERGFSPFASGTSMATD